MICAIEYKSLNQIDVLGNMPSDDAACFTIISAVVSYVGVKKKEAENVYKRVVKEKVTFNHEK